MNKSAPTQRDLAKSLGITPARVSQLKTAGMPVTNLAAAKKWIQKKTKDSDGAKPGSLAEGRLRLILLQCSILEARLAKENDTSQLMKTSELEKGLGFILQMMTFGLQKEAEGLTVRLVGLTEADAYDQIKLFLVGNFLEGSVATIERSNLDPRLSRVLRRVVAESIVKVRSPKPEAASHHHA